MLYETIFQFEIFLCIFYFGLIAGILQQIKKILSFDNLVLVNIWDFVHIVISGILYIVAINMFNYGETRFFTILAFLIGYVVEIKTIGKLVENIVKLVYNVCNKLLKKIKKVNKKDEVKL